MKISHGECIKLMVINGLGFTSRPLYLEVQFFSSRPGNRFLKEPAFMTPAVYLKSQKRITALAMVVCLCLLVYTIAQRYLRQRLEQARACVPNQLGKPTRTPTMRWIFQLFEGVHLLIRITEDKIEEIVLKMNPVRNHILAILGPRFEKIYGSG